MKETIDAAGGPMTPVSAGGTEAAVVVVGRGKGPLARTERGMVSAEWAVGIIAAVAMAGMLLAAITSGPVQDILMEYILKVIRAFAFPR